MAKRESSPGISPAKNRIRYRRGSNFNADAPFLNLHKMPYILNHENLTKTKEVTVFFSLKPELARKTPAVTIVYSVDWVKTPISKYLSKTRPGQAAGVLINFNNQGLGILVIISASVTAPVATRSKSALLARFGALKVPFSWKLYHALIWGWGKH